MKRMIQCFAEYNAKVDAKLVGILKTQDLGLLREDQGAFYKSILGTLEHILSADLIWLKRFSGFYAYKCLDSSHLITGDLSALKARASASQEDLFALLSEADSLMVAFSKEIEEDQLASKVKFKNMKGEELEKEYWALAIHVLVHATHHRGEISALLDRKGISNDISGFNMYFG